MTGHDPRRDENMRLMRSPASVILLAASLATVALASVFYDHPLMKEPQVFASFRQQITQ